jgi:DNA invertase Pin-like site-specific DNA recombinase
MRETNLKVTASHLKRDAYLYVRQSTVRQLFENTESTKRQYALRQRAVALGWPLDRVRVIDNDLGQSGSSATDRKGFQNLVAGVSMRQVGIVLGLEVSRLARNNADWHRLLEICAISDTLILDEDGLYNPNDFNDRLLLGLKGAMSEAELHIMHTRLQGGILNKAKRGELVMPLPVGLIYDAQKKVKLDPDKQVRETIRLFFQIFKRTGSAMMTVKEFKKQCVQFPRRILTGPKKGELVWGDLLHSRALQILHNPRYAGAFVYGRHRSYKQISGKPVMKLLAKDDWHTLIPGAHEGYIVWEEFEENQRILRESSQAYGHDRRKSPPREGPSLLQGIIMCGKCGKRMTVRYNYLGQNPVTRYVCQRDGIEHAEKICSNFHGTGIDKAVGDLLLKTLMPHTLNITLAVQQELYGRLEETDSLRQKQVQRIQYEAELAKQRYMKVDPNNRLVADSLEAEWNEKLRALQLAQEEYKSQRKNDLILVDEEIRSRIMELASDFPKLWSDPQTSDRDRKRMIRLLIEDVTLIKKDQTIVHVRFKGGVSKTLILPLVEPSWTRWKTSNKVVSEIDRLLDTYTEKQIVNELNKAGYRSGKGKQFNSRIVANIIKSYDLKSRYNRLIEAGMLAAKEISQQLNVCCDTIKAWRRNGLIHGIAYNDQGYLYDPQQIEVIRLKKQNRKLSHKLQYTEK